MRNFLFCFFITFLISSSALAESLDQKKDELKKIYLDGGISKLEYKKALQFLENSNEKIQKGSKKKIFSIKNKQKKKNKNLLGLAKKDEEEITLEKIAELGKPVKPTLISMKVKKEFETQINTLNEESNQLLARLERLEKVALGSIQSKDMASNKIDYTSINNDLKKSEFARICYYYEEPEFLQQWVPFALWAPKCAPNRHFAVILRECSFKMPNCLTKRRTSHPPWRL